MAAKKERFWYIDEGQGDTNEGRFMRIGIVEDKFNGLPVEMAEIYVHNLLDILSKLEDLQMLNCENCDEID